VIEDLIEGWRDMEAALADYCEAEAYYEGDVPEVFASAIARKAIAETGDRYRFNLAKTPVDVRVDRVEIVAVTVPENPELSAVIEQVWDANEMAVTYPDLFRTCFMYGDAYLMVWPTDDDEKDARLREAGVELQLHNPKNVRVFYDPEHPRQVTHAIKRWRVKSEGGDQWRADLYYPDRIERWRSKPDGDLATPDGWAPFLDDDQDPDNWSLDNPTERVPFVHYRTATPYGRPVHRAAFSPQDAINKLLITQLTTTDSHGWPQRYALTDRGADLDTASDVPDWDDDADSDDRVENRLGGAVSQLRSGPGTIMDLVGKRAVGQFDAANPSVFLDPASFYVRLMAQMTTTPLHYFDPGGGTPSGESLKVADMPLTRDVEHLERRLLAPVVATWQTVLDLVEGDADRIDVRWAPVESSTGMSDWETAKAKQDAGVPRHQALIEAGYEAQQVEEWHTDEAEAMGLAQQAELLSSIAEAMYRLSSCVTLGTLSQDEASSITNAVLGDVFGDVAFDEADPAAKVPLPPRS
jgi:hypothetical protein